jgi:hypothetical protein
MLIMIGECRARCVETIGCGFAGLAASPQLIMEAGGRRVEPVAPGTAYPGSVVRGTACEPDLARSKQLATTEVADPCCGPLQAQPMRAAERDVREPDRSRTVAGACLADADECWT